MDIDPDSWLKDKINENFVQLHRIEDVLYDGQTKYQHARIVRSTGLGMCLVLDGKIQSSMVDEHVYHEALVQPAMLAHPGPESVFIAGGGEGATLREALYHKSVKRAVMVDIDDEVVAISRKYLPDESRGAFDDARTELYHTDARQYLADCDDKYDVIIIDLPDPIDEGPAYRLFTREFYGLVRDRLTANGIISVQAGSAMITELLNLSAVHNTLKSAFPHVSACKIDMPCFGGPWGFCLASVKTDVASLSPEDVDGRIAARGLSHLKFYDGITHRGMFALPRYIREALAAQARIISDDQPLFLYENQ